MNPEQTLSQVGEKLMSVAKDYAGKIYVCYRNKEFVVVRDTDRGLPFQIVTSYKSETIREGLTVPEWNHLRRKIAKATKEPK